MTQEQPSKKGMPKSKKRAMVKDKAYYKLQFGTSDDNKKKKLLRHCRNNPLDYQSYERLTKLNPKLKYSVSPRGQRKLRFHASHKDFQFKLFKQCREEIQRMRQHNVNQQAIQGPLLSEIGFRESLKTIRFKLRRAA